MSRTRTLSALLVGGSLLLAGDVFAQKSPKVAGTKKTPAAAQGWANSERVDLIRDVSLLVGEGAIATPSFTNSLPVGKKGAKVPVQTVKVEEGRVDAALGESRIARGLLLQGPDKILGISTGGRMAMIVTEESISIAAFDGDVLVGNDSKFKPLKEGMVRVFSRVTGVGTTSALPPKPTLTSKQALTVALRGAVGVKLTSNSKQPLRLVVTDQKGQLVPQGKPTLPGKELVAQLPRAGIYHAAVRSLGTSGFEGPLSQKVKIQVLGLAPGQRPAEGGVFYLETGERVRLLGAEGLEVRYGSSPDFFPASSSVGLSQNRATQAEFRHPAHPTQTAVIKVAPRVSKTRVELGPASAQWPGKPVTMTVGVWNGTGKLMDHEGATRIKVTVNSKPQKVMWRETPRGYYGVILPQAGPGPWVVRLKVTDEHGRTLARDFLEVAEK